ncbi:unnamed protein product [Dibothriocephalus latus]|uniref:Uncharacterized protein n=1 Tax=Dibothriocephalus latus TaxID=60516 RepID=A0A3P7NUY8_DIBLA|nr:unnamed protein product [Dibothriocephalus latus]
MPSRAALICLLVLAFVVLLCTAHPKEEEAIENDLLESALSAADIPETPAEMNAESIEVIRPAGFFRRPPRFINMMHNFLLILCQQQSI